MTNKCPLKLPLRVEDDSKHPMFPRWRVVDAKGCVIAVEKYKDKSDYICEAINSYNSLTDKLEITERNNQYLAKQILKTNSLTAENARLRKWVKFLYERKDKNYETMEALAEESFDKDLAIFTAIESELKEAEG